MCGGCADRGNGERGQGHPAARTRSPGCADKVYGGADQVYGEIGQGGLCIEHLFVRCDQ